MNIFYKLTVRIILWISPVVILSYPKSGRTWLRVILNDLVVYPSFDHLQTKFSFLKNPHEITNGVETLSNKKVIFLHRDPHDVVVSAYHYYKNNKGYHDLNLGDFIRAPEMGFEKIVAFNCFVMKNPQIFKAYLPISYEELSENPVYVLKKCMKFMSIPLPSDEKIERVVEQNNFANMQRKEKDKVLQRQHGDTLFSSPVNDIGNQSLKVRRGQVQGYLDELNDSDLQYCREIIDRYGFSLNNNSI